MHFREKSIHFFSAQENFSQQDTIVKNNQDTIPKSNTSIINLQPVKTIDLSAIDSILRRSEEREREIAEQKPVVQRPVYRRVDTTEIFYKQFGIAGFPLQENLKNDKFRENVFLNFNEYKPEDKELDRVFDYIGETENVVIAEQDVETTIPITLNEEIQFDWITFLLIGAVLLLGWVRLFNKKFIGSIFKAAFSYNESFTLLREKNSLMERASFILNTVFVSSISLFVIQTLGYFDIQVQDYQNHIIYIFAFLGFVSLYLLRFISAKFVGSLFLQQRSFDEYLHNVNIYTKVTGLTLLPIVVVLQYLTFQHLSLVIWAGAIIIIFFYLVQILRAFQILIRNNVSIFYMILYLCAFEISPFLIVYKLLLS